MDEWSIHFKEHSTLNPAPKNAKRNYSDSCRQFTAGQVSTLDSESKRELKGRQFCRRFPMRLNLVKRVALLAGLCLVVCALAMIFIFRSVPKEPVYDGHPISFWFNKLPLTMVRSGGFVMSVDTLVDGGGRLYGVKSGLPNAAFKAIQEIGTNGLPFLIGKLSRRETPKFAQSIQLWAFQHGLKHSVLPNPEIERAQAVTALLALKPLPPEAVAQIHQLSNNRTNPAALSAAYVLGPPAKMFGHADKMQLP
jgi:hypothetical protein